MSKNISLIVGQKFLQENEKSELIRYEEQDAFVDTRLESFGYLMENCVLKGAELVIDPNQNSAVLTEGVISNGDRIWRAFSMTIKPKEANSTYFIGFQDEVGYIYGPTEPTSDYYRLWTITTDGQKRFTSKTDFRGEVGPKFKKEFDFGGGGGGSDLYVMVDDFPGSDTEKLKAAILKASTTNHKVVLANERMYQITDTIVISNGVELRGGKGTHYSIMGNFKGFEVEGGASINRAFISIEYDNYTSDVIYLDGKHKYENSRTKTQICDLVIWNWRATVGGNGITLYSGGDTDHIQYLNIERITLFNLLRGIYIKVVNPPSGQAWVNANRFDKITFSDCANMIDIDSSIGIPFEASGNSFNNLQIQPGGNTQTILKVSGMGNQFQGTLWDTHLIPHDGPICILSEESADTSLDIKWLNYDRVVNNGASSNASAGLKALATIEQGFDWNTATIMGTYRVVQDDGTFDSAKGQPPSTAYTYGVMIVFQNDDSVAQLYFPHQSSEGIYYRSKFGTDDWTGWRQFAVMPTAPGGADDDEPEWATDLPATQDWNLLLPGMYQIGQEDGSFNAAYNQPPTNVSTYGVLTVQKVGLSYFQQYIPANSQNGYYFRSCYNGGTWEEWLQIKPEYNAEVPGEPEWATDLLITQNWNELLPGMYQIGQTSFNQTLNQPPTTATSYGVLEVQKIGLSSFQQFYPNVVDEGVFIRTCLNGSWTTWYQISPDELSPIDEGPDYAEDVPAGQDWNLLAPGLFQIGQPDNSFNPTLNQPPSDAYTYGVLLVERIGTTYYQQYVSNNRNDGIYFRSAYNGVWSTWIQIKPYFEPVEPIYVPDLSETQDWNQLAKGVYQIGQMAFSGTLNQPNITEFAYGILEVVKTGGSIFQIYIPNNGDGICFRSCYNGGTWTQWSQTLIEGSVSGVPIEQKRELLFNQDWNLLTEGTFRVNQAEFSPTYNQPFEAYGFGILQVFSFGATVLQYYQPHEETGTYIRSKHSLYDWNNWTQLATQESITDLQEELALHSSNSSIHRNIIVSTGNPTGGNNGDIWLKYE